MKSITFRKPSVVAVLAAVIVAAALLVLAGSLTRPAEAAVPGLVRVQGFSAFDSTGEKTASVSCPSGKKVIGTGAELEGADGQVMIRAVLPDSSLGTVQAAAYEDETGTAANWWIRVYGVCADPLPGLVRVRTDSSVNSASPKQMTAGCPSGKKLTGTGAQIVSLPGQVVLDDVIPSLGLGSVLVTGYEDETGTAADWWIRAYAICADPLPGLVRITNASASDSTSPKSTSTPCSGKLLTGTGFEIIGGSGQVVLDDLRPHSALTSHLATAYEDETGTAANWQIKGYAICA